MRLGKPKIIPNKKKTLPDKVTQTDIKTISPFESVYQLTTDYCCAAFITDSNGNIIKTAPILNFLLGKNISKYLDYWTRCKYSLEKIK
jgi:hypothetical protein